LDKKALLIYTLENINSDRESRSPSESRGHDYYNNIRQGRRDRSRDGFEPREFGRTREIPTAENLYERDRRGFNGPYRRSSRQRQMNDNLGMENAIVNGKNHFNLT
jgi:hypothetical protein